VRSLGGPIGVPLDESQVADLLAALAAYTAAPAIVVAEVTGDARQTATLNELLSHGRSNEIVVLLGAETIDQVDSSLAQNTALTLVSAQDGSLTDSDGNAWSLSD